MPAAVVRAVPAILRKREVKDEPRLGVLPPEEPHRVLEPKLAVLGPGLVGKQVEGRRPALGKVGMEGRQQPPELLLWIKPHAHPRPLLVGESLLDLGDEGGGKHGQTGAD